MKRKLLSVFLALCMTLTLVPAASAHLVLDDGDGIIPADAKFMVQYHTPQELVETRYFDNVSNDDWGGEDSSDGDHFWDPITVMKDDEKLSDCTYAVITLLDDITLTDTTILVSNGYNIIIDGGGHTITCNLTGTLGGDPGSTHVAGQDAISIASDNENNSLMLRHVTVEIKGPQTEGTDSQIVTKDTQGIYNDGELYLDRSAKVTIDGVSQNGINGSGRLLVSDTSAVNIKNVGGSGIKGEYIAVSNNSTITVNGAMAHGVTVDDLFVTQASVTTEDTALYGVIINSITLEENSVLSSTCAEGAEVPAPIRVVDYGEIAANTTINGTVWADNLDGDGSSKVDALTSAASVGNTKYATLEDAVENAEEHSYIQLLRDVTLTKKLTIDKAITLEGDNHTITGKKDSTDVYIEITGGDVIIRKLNVKDFGGNVDTNTQCSLFKVPEGENTHEGHLILNTVTASNFNCAAVDIRKGTFGIWDSSFDCANESGSKLTKGVLAQNVEGTISNTTIKNTNTSSTESNSDWENYAVETFGNTKLTTEGCTFGTDGAEVQNGVIMNTGDGASTVHMVETTIDATNNIVKLNSNDANGSQGTSDVIIGSGSYTGAFNINQGTAEGNGCFIRILSGYFTADPSAYITEGTHVEKSDQSGYNFMVVGLDEGDGDIEIKPANAKFQVRYYTEMGGKLIDTRYFENSNNDDSFGGKRDHIWDPVAVRKDDPALADKGCTYASITLYEDISLEDTTIFVDEGTCVAIYSDNGDAAGHTITCKLSGNVSPAQDDSRAGMDAISVASGEHGLGTMPENHLTFYNVNVDIIGPTSSRASGGGTGTNITHGINNGCRINLQDGTSVSIDGVTGNGVNGSGELFLVDNYMTPNTVNLDIKNVGGSGIKASYLSTYDREIAVTVDNASEYGIDVDELNMYNSSITTTNTGLYGVTVANGIELGWGSSISATLQDNAAVPAPIRLENGELYAIFDNITVNGTVLLGDNATVTGEGKDNVKTMRYAAAIGDTSYVTLDQAIQAAQEGQTVKLRQDVTLSTPLIINKAITLEGNGKTITGQKNSSDVFLKVTGNNVTLQNLKAKDFGGSAVVTQGDTNLTITGCTFGQPGAEVKNGVSVNTGTGASTVTMQNTTIAATDAIVELTPDTDTGTSTVNIESGYYTGGFKVNPGSVEGKGCDIKVSGGYFTADPTSYLTEQKAALVSDNPNYIFVVKKASANAADVLAGESAVDESLPSGATKEDEDLAKKISSAIKNATTAPTFEGGVSAAANEVANDNDLTGNSSDVTSALSSAGVLTEGKSVSIVIQPYMDISITKADSANNTFTLDITPMYRTIATTANLSNNEEIHLSGESKNAAEVVPSAKLAVTKPVTISIPLPTGFNTENGLWVKHTKDSGKVYYYQGTVSAEMQSNKQLLTFVNPKGFSSFEIMSGFTPVASIGDVNFASLQDAINDVSDGGTIKLLANDQTATVSQEISFKVDLNNFTANITAGFGYTMSVDKSTNTYTFTKKASTGGGGGGTSTPTYTITTGSTSNGTVTVNPKNPTKGSTVTVNVTPNDGYQLDTLTVTDANGKNVEVKKKTDTEYTFTMPASKVTVSAVFVEIPEEPTPSVPQFTDVSEGAWYYDAVRYVCEKGMMNGVAEGTFAPNSTTDRAMLVTILYRLENEPAASGSSFADVPSGQWYTDAVAWAAANGIVNGVTDTTFAPNCPITREQMAAILYRYAAWKGCDVSGQVDLSGYTDADSVSTYAKEALAWANAEGLITGVTDTTLRPAGSAVRAQAATILMRLCENVLA